MQGRRGLDEEISNDFSGQNIKAADNSMHGLYLVHQNICFKGYDK